MQAVFSSTRINPVYHCAYQLCDKPSWESLEIDGGKRTLTPFLDMSYAALNVRLMFVSRDAVEFDLIVVSTKIVTDAFGCVIHKYALDRELAQFIRDLDLGYASQHCRLVLFLHWYNCNMLYVSRDRHEERNTINMHNVSRQRNFSIAFS